MPHVRNRLLGQTCYLAGPIDRCPDSGRQWRLDLTPQLRARGILVFDPLAKPIDIAVEAPEFRAERAADKQAGLYGRFARQLKTIRHVDLRMVDRADFLIVRVDETIHMCGTYEEVVTANRSKKPVLVHCPNGKRRVPDWLFGMLPHSLFFDRMADLLAYLDTVAHTDTVDAMDRWLLLDPLVVYHPEFVAQLMAARRRSESGEPEPPEPPGEPGGPGAAAGPLGRARSAACAGLATLGREVRAWWQV